MNIGLPLSLGAIASTLAPNPAFTAVATDGWQLTVTDPQDPPELAPTNVNRAGFDASGNAVTVIDTVYTGKRVREPYPNEGTFTANSVAATEYIYADDVIPGAVNNSTEDSPKPICRWVMPQRLVVGSSIHWEIIAFHLNAKNGKPVASVHVRATDGTNSTAWQIVSSMSVSTYVEDARPTAVYQGDLDITSLPDNTLYWLEAKVFPHYGVAGSVEESTSSNDVRVFGRRYYTKNTTLAAAPPLVYVSSAGNDTTGAVSTDAATAAASPCLTLQGALNRAGAVLAGGILDGLRVRIVDTVAFGTSASASRLQSSGAVIVERAPGTARSAAIVQQSSAQGFRLGHSSSLNVLLTVGALVFYDVTVQRTGAGQMGNGGSPNVEFQMWNCATDIGSVTGAWGSTGVTFSHFGNVLSNVASNTLSLSANQTQYMLRGVVATGTGAGYEGGCVVGSTLTAYGTPAFADAQQGAVWYNSAYLSPSSSNAPISIVTTNAGETITGVAIVQCFVEPTHTTSSTPGVRPCSDGANGNCTHAVIHHNVSLGAGTLGRWNLFYDEAAVARFYKFISVKGNICPQINVKGDVFDADGTRLGNRALIHGVGCLGNFTKYAVNSVATEAQAYAGRDSDIGTSTTVLNDPLFVDDRGTTYNGSIYTAGLGGSDVHLDTGSPCIGIVSELLLAFDYAGNARSGVQDAGLYA